MSSRDNSAEQYAERFNLGIFQKVWSVDAVRSVTWAAIHIALLLLALVSFPIVLVFFFAGALVALPIVAFGMGCRFVLTYFNLFGLRRVSRDT